MKYKQAIHTLFFSSLLCFILSYWFDQKAAINFNGYFYFYWAKFGIYDSKEISISVTSIT